MLAPQRLAVHLVAQQRLRVPRAGHVDRLVVVVRARDLEIARVRIGANLIQRVSDANAAVVADDVPSLDAEVPRVLHDLGKAAEIVQRIVAGALASPDTSSRHSSRSTSGSP